MGRDSAQDRTAHPDDEEQDHGAVTMESDCISVVSTTKIMLRSKANTLAGVDQLLRHGVSYVKALQRSKAAIAGCASRISRWFSEQAFTMV